MAEGERDVGSVNYSSQIAPPGYSCDKCGVHGVRLWREYQSMGRVVLLCADCTEERQRKSHDPGWQSEFNMGSGDTIGWFVPAIPIEGQAAYLGYPGMPKRAYDWWKRLPTK